MWFFRHFWQFGRECKSYWLFRSLSVSLSLYLALSLSLYPSLSFSIYASLQLEDGWLDDEHSEFLEELKMEMLEEQRREDEEMERAAKLQDQVGDNKEKCVFTGHIFIEQFNFIYLYNAINN